MVARDDGRARRRQVLGAADRDAKPQQAEGAGEEPLHVVVRAVGGSAPVDAHVVDS